MIVARVSTRTLLYSASKDSPFCTSAGLNYTISHGTKCIASLQTLQQSLAESKITICTGVTVKLQGNWKHKGINTFYIFQNIAYKHKQHVSFPVNKAQSRLIDLFDINLFI